MPVRCRPKRMMTTPAIRASSDLYCASTWPTSVEIAPRVMNTMLNPIMNAAEFSITFRRSCPSFSFNCSTPTPEIREAYPGTSGRTQGERNENTPATNTARGSGKVVISVYCNERAEVCVLSKRCRRKPDCYNIWTATWHLSDREVDITQDKQRR